MNVHREEKQYNTGTISPLNKNLLKTRCLVAIWQTLHPEEGVPLGGPGEARVIMLYAGFWA